MFYYLHLTRAPPERADAAQPLLITPNIANDLRTEYPTPQAGEGIDIFYAWVKCVASESESESNSSEGKLDALGSMTSPQKLTRWMGNAYKEVQVFPPKEALSAVQTSTGSSRWRLLLCTRSQHSGAVHVQRSVSTSKAFTTSVDFSLSPDAFGIDVLPILSSPVQFTNEPQARSGVKGSGRGATNAHKQVRNERVFKLPPILSTAESVRSTSIASPIGPLRITEYLSYDLDKKVWDSGVGLSYFLASSFKNSREVEADVPEVIRRLVQSNVSTVLELGAGTGLVSIVLSTLLSRYCGSEQSQTRVVATDLESAMEVLQTNISSNAQCYPSVPLGAAILDWDDETLPPEVQDGVDFIIMADVTYNTSSFPSLIRTLSRLSRLCATSPTVLLSYKERDPDERRFWGFAREIGLEFKKVGRINGAGGMSVEIYEGTFSLER